MPAVARDFYLLQNVQMGPRALHILLFSGYWGSFPGIRWLWCEVDHSSPSNAKVKNEWGCVSSPPVCLPGKVSLLFTRFQDNRSPPVEFMACRNICHVDLIPLTYLKLNLL